MQVTGWGTQQRAQYESFRSVFSCAAYLSSSRVFKALGNLGALQVIPTPSHLLDRVSPIFSPFFLVFCAFSPSGRDGSNEPQAGTQGQETAGASTKTRDLGPSFDTPDANQRINWQTFAHTVASAQQHYNDSGQTRSVNPWISLGAGYHPTANRTGANELLPGTECERRPLSLPS